MEQPDVVSCVRVCVCLQYWEKIVGWWVVSKDIVGNSWDITEKGADPILGVAQL